MEKRRTFRFINLLKKIGSKYREWNARLGRYHSPAVLAAAATVVCAAVMAVMLFVPPYIGVGNDSVAAGKMRAYGLFYLEKDEGYAPNEYFIRVYEKGYTDAHEISSQAFLVETAKVLDDLFTRDNLFDVRFLALIYAVLWLPGVFLAIKAALDRVDTYIESAALAILGALIFADVGYISYFNSLYVDALEYICMLYIAGAGLALGRRPEHKRAYLMIFVAAGFMLAMGSRRGFLSGAVLVLFCFQLLRVFEGHREKILVFSCCGLLSAAFVCSAAWGTEEFTETDKVHAMTRGVLLQSTDPVRTLDEFGISSAYSVLTDESLYEYYPATEIENSLLREGFLDKYSTQDLIFYYCRHPGSLSSLWDIGVKAGFSIRRSYCGNYEASAGRPAMAGTLFWSAWSTFKERSAPKTIGYLVLLVVAVLIIAGRKGMGRYGYDKNYFVYLCLMLTFVLIGIGDLTYVIIKSGDAVMVQFNMVIGICIDLLTYYVLAELLRRLNILAEH